MVKPILAWFCKMQIVNCDCVQCIFFMVACTKIQCTADYTTTVSVFLNNKNIARFFTVCVADKSLVCSLRLKIDGFSSPKWIRKGLVSSWVITHTAYCNATPPINERHQKKRKKSYFCSMIKNKFLFSTKICNFLERKKDEQSSEKLNYDSIASWVISLWSRS